jgi:amino-acid N-acetyltransferase
VSALPQRAELPVLGSHDAGVLPPLSGPVLVVEDGGAAIVIRRAVASDVGAMHALQADFVAARILLARGVEQIRASIDAYVVAADGERILGTGMLKVYSPELAEICALAVDPAYQKHGLGRRIVAALIEQAAQRAIPRVIALTLQDGFFHRLGFSTTALSALPEKVAADCMACPKKHACDEIAVVRAVAPAFSNLGRS